MLSFALVDPRTHTSNDALFATFDATLDEPNERRTPEDIEHPYHACVVCRYCFGCFNFPTVQVIFPVEGIIDGVDEYPHKRRKSKESHESSGRIEQFQDNAQEGLSGDVLILPKKPPRNQLRASTV
jgi:hypothetical protein